MRKITSNDWKAIPWLYRRMSRHKIPIGVITITSAAQSALAVVFALCTQQVVDSASASFQAGKVTQEFITSVILLAAVILGSILCSLFNQLTSEGLSIRLERDLRHELYHKILKADYASLTRYHSGDLVNRMNSDVNSVNEGVMHFIPATLSVIVTLVTAIIALSSRAPQFTWVLLAVTVAVAAGTLLFRRKIKDLTKRVNESNGKYSGYIQETMENLLMVHAFDVSGRVEKKADELLSEREQVRRERRKFNLMLSTSMPILAYLIAFGTLVYCGYQVLQGNLTVGGLTAMTQLAARIQSPIHNLPYLMRYLMTTGGAAERLMEIDQLTEESEEAALDRDVLWTGAVSIGARNLCFEYEELQEQGIEQGTLQKTEHGTEHGTGHGTEHGTVQGRNNGQTAGRFRTDGSHSTDFVRDCRTDQSDSHRRTVFRNVSFELPVHGMSVITGPSGIGKSTLLKLLLGIYRQDSGELYIKYQDGSELPISRKTRSLFTYVPQGNLLLSGTLRENILLAAPKPGQTSDSEAANATTPESGQTTDFGAANAPGADQIASAAREGAPEHAFNTDTSSRSTEELLQEALYVSSLDEYIAELPEGLDTRIGENAQGLSEGQAQRLSLARAVISGAPVLLLDEVTSSLDQETERKVVERLKGLQGRNCLIVTHRPAPLQMADYELRVDQEITVRGGL